MNQNDNCKKYCSNQSRSEKSSKIQILLVFVIVYFSNMYAAASGIIFILSVVCL